MYECHENFSVFLTHSLAHFRTHTHTGSHIQIRSVCVCVYACVLPVNESKKLNTLKCPFKWVNQEQVKRTNLTRFRCLSLYAIPFILFERLNFSVSAINWKALKYSFPLSLSHFPVFFSWARIVPNLRCGTVNAALLPSHAFIYDMNIAEMRVEQVWRKIYHNFNHSSFG